MWRCRAEVNVPRGALKSVTRAIGLVAGARVLNPGDTPYEVDLHESKAPAGYLISYVTSFKVGPFATSRHRPSKVVRLQGESLDHNLRLSTRDNIHSSSSAHKYKNVVFLKSHDR